MKDFALDDLTKKELIKVIEQSLAYQPTQKVLQWIRWETMCEQAQALMQEVIEEGQLYSNKTDMASHAKWMESSKKFDNAMKLSDKSEAFLTEIKQSRICA